MNGNSTYYRRDLYKYNLYICPLFTGYHESTEANSRAPNW